MKTTLNEKKIQAIKQLKKLKIYKPYINEFKENDTICFFEKYGGFGKQYLALFGERCCFFAGKELIWKWIYDIIKF